MDRELLLAILKSPFAVALATFAFMAYVMYLTLVPLLQMATTTIPAKMDVVISKLDVCLSDKLAEKPRKAGLKNGG